MARPYGKAPFNPSEPVTVRRRFIANGRHWTPGDTFDWRRRSLDQRKVKVLFESGFLSQSDEKIVEAAEEVVAEATIEAAEEVVAEEGVEEEGVEDELSEIDSMAVLREIAEEEGASFKISKIEQRQAIRDNRKAKSDE